MSPGELPRRAPTLGGIIVGIWALPAAVLTLYPFDVEVATFQAVADPQINVLLEGSVLDAGVVGVVEYGYATEMRAARGSLGRLTNENPGRTARAWKNWWAEHGVEWKQNVPAAKGEERDG